MGIGEKNGSQYRFRRWETKEEVVKQEIKYADKTEKSHKSKHPMRIETKDMKSISNSISYSLRIKILVADDVFFQLRPFVLFKKIIANV
jgi:hypothetical protein